ncbi:ATP-grasp domain-containing protein [Sphaerimonospora sp. CA-214678]|uniref:ATP-grasp domain-containing protein n=1 Tax=Sphaerimonospora sp. CA-214678 TaxID=3240029 RepID=UPI003D8C4D49
MTSAADGCARTIIDRLRFSSTTVDLRSAAGAVSWLPPVGEDSVTAAPCVVLAERTGCREFAVLQVMLHRLGVPSVRIDTESMPTLRVEAAVGDGPPSAGGVTVDGHRIEPTVVWTRHLSPRALRSGDDPAAALVRADSWCAFLGQMSALGRLPTLSPVGLPGRCPGRLEQIAGAAGAGVRVPRTVVTTDPRSARAEISSARAVIKVVDEHFVEPAPGLLVGVFPQVVSREELGRRPPLDFPVIVQEHVEHEAELRVYHLAGAVHTFAVDKAAPDALWRDGSEVSIRSVATPRAAAEAVRRLADLWGLTYGAFDLLISGGDVVFLEVNVDGDWLWFESKAGTSVVSAAAAGMVRALHRTTLRRTARHGTASQVTDPSIGLLDFLLLGSRADLGAHSDLGAHPDHDPRTDLGHPDHGPRADLGAHSDLGSVPTSWAPLPVSGTGERRRPTQREDDHDENSQSENMR